jgi:hypothetical protein
MANREMYNPQDPTHVLLHFPNQQACIDILEILRPFSAQSRELLLAAVQANLDRYPERHVGAPVNAMHLAVSERPLPSVFDAMDRGNA